MPLTWKKSCGGSFLAMIRITIMRAITNVKMKAARTRRARLRIWRFRSSSVAEDGAGTMGMWVSEEEGGYGSVLMGQIYGYCAILYR